MLRRLPLITSLVALVALTGCFWPTVKAETASQQDVIGDVHVDTTLCPFNLLDAYMGDLDPDDLGCKTEAQVLDGLYDPDIEFDLPLPSQTLAAYRLPVGATAPETLTASAKVVHFEDWAEVVGVEERRLMPQLPVREHTITLRRDTRLAEQTKAFYEQEDISGPDGEEIDVTRGGQLVGYVSDQIPGAVIGDIDLKLPVGLPVVEGGAKPYTGPLNALTLLGTRVAFDDDQIGIVRRSAAVRAAVRKVSKRARVRLPRDTHENPLSPNRPVDCEFDTGDSPLPLPINSEDLTICPLPALHLTEEPPSEDEVADMFAGKDVATRDLVIAGGEGFAEQGSTASVPFTLKAAGPAGGDLTVTAATALAGVPAQQRGLTFPGTGDHAAPVSIAVPANAAPGTYPVTLTVEHGNAKRTATATVVVLPKPAPPAQTAAQSIVRDNLYLDSKGYVSFGWVCPPLCGKLQGDVLTMKAGISPTANTAQVSKPRLLRIGKDTFSAKSGKRTRVKVKLYPKAIRAIKKGKAVKALVVVRKGGKGVPTLRRVVIKQRKK